MVLKGNECKILVCILHEVTDFARYETMHFEYKIKKLKPCLLQLKHILIVQLTVVFFKYKRNQLSNQNLNFLKKIKQCFIQKQQNNISYIIHKLLIAYVIVYFLCIASNTFITYRH